MRKKAASGEKFYYGFSLSDRVPQDHLLRRVRPLIDQEAIWRMAEPYYSATGAPSVDPVVVLKMSLLGYFFGITSECRLAEECRLNLAFMWFLGYDLDEIPPDHSILSKARARFGPALYEWFFGLIVRACRDAGLIDGNRLVLDATLIRANASLDSLVSRSLHVQLPATEDYLDQVWAENPVEVEEAQDPEEPNWGR